MQKKVNTFPIIPQILFHKRLSKTSKTVLPRQIIGIPNSQHEIDVAAITECKIAHRYYSHVRGWYITMVTHVFHFVRNYVFVFNVLSWVRERLREISFSPTNVSFVHRDELLFIQFGKQVGKFAKISVGKFYYVFISNAW